MQLANNKKYLIVTRREYFPILFSYKNKHPNLNLKLIDKQEFASMISFSFAKDPIPLLLKKKIDYSDAKKFVHIFLFGDLDKNSNVKNIFDSIPADYITHDEYANEELKCYDNVVFFEMNEDKELIDLTNRKNVSFDCATFQDLYFEDELIEEKLDENYLSIVNFKNKFLQFTYIYSNIRKLLLEDPSLQDKITIVCDGDGDLYYANYCSKLFDINTLVVTKRKILTIESIRKKMRDIFNKRSFSFTEEENDPDLKILKNLIDKYELNTLNDFAFAYSCLTEIVNSTSFNQVDSKSGISITTDFNLSDRTINYITNFKHGTFYEIFSDNDVLSDKELEELHVNTSYVKTKIDKRFKENYLRYTNTNLVSRVTQHLSDKLFDSEFIEEFDWKKKIKRFDYEDYKDRGEMVFTNNASEIFTAYLLDGFFCTKAPDFHYRTYDNSYKQIDGKIFADDKTYYLTNLEKYIDCPFAYYMNRVLPINDFDPRIRYKGDLVHKLCENIFDKGYKFEAEWAKAVDTYKKCFKDENIEYTPYDDVMLDIYHAHLKRVMPLYAAHALEMGYVDSLAEFPVYFSIEDEKGKKYKFSGKIDKIVKSQAEDENGNMQSFWTIIDYKTGSESFDIFSTKYGKSVQLPLYYYALKTIKENEYPDESFKNPLEDADKLRNLIDDATFGGFGIQHVYGNSLKGIFGNKDQKLSEDTVKANSVLKGVSFYNSTYYKSFDLTMPVDKNGKIKSGTYLNISYKFTDDNAEENVIGDKSGLEIYNLSNIVKDSIDGMLYAIDKINNNVFPIAPAPRNSLKDKVDESNNNGLPCAFCKYKNICYHKSYDKANYSEEIKKYFKLKGGK